MRSLRLWLKLAEPLLGLLYHDGIQTSVLCTLEASGRPPPSRYVAEQGEHLHPVAVEPP